MYTRFQIKIMLFESLCIKSFTNAYRKKLAKF